MKLYNFDPSPNPLKVRVALAELGVDYETMKIILFKGEQNSKMFLKINPHGKVPALVDGDLTISESNAILSYLGREYGKSLWPKSPAHEAKAMQWLFFEAAQMASCFGSIWFNKFGLPKLGRKPESFESSVMRDSIERAVWAITHLEAHLSKNTFILGEDFSLVDASIGVQLAALHQTLLGTGEKFPAVYKYKEAFTNRASWKSARGSAIWD